MVLMLGDDEVKFSAKDAKVSSLEAILPRFLHSQKL